MRAETPSWPFSNFFNVLFCVWFLLLLPLTSVYYVFQNNASAFLDFFKVFHTLEFSTIGENFTEQSGVYLFPFLF